MLRTREVALHAVCVRPSPKRASRVKMADAAATALAKEALEQALAKEALEQALAKEALEQALVGLEQGQCEPARAFALDLTLLGHLLESRLVGDDVCSVDSGFAKVWKQHVVPIAAASRTEWEMGMCAEIVGNLRYEDSGSSFSKVVGRLHSRIPDDKGGGWQIIIQGPDGMGAVKVKLDDIKATAHAGAVLSLWRIVPLTPSPYAMVRDASNGRDLHAFRITIYDAAGIRCECEPR